MYEQYYGMKEKPFSLTPDTEFLYLNRRFREALEKVLYGIKRHEGFTVVVGDVGTGKTTLCWTLLSRLDSNVRSALILNPLLTEEDMLRAIVQDFGVQLGGVAPDASDAGAQDWMRGLTKKQLVDVLNLFLLAGTSDDTINILIIDEAQNLSREVLEQLRILSNLETPKKKLLQIIFVGQLEFEEKLRLPALRQLNQRITTRCELKPLSREDAEQYILHRVRIAGASRHLHFARGALRRIYRYSKGYPRLINIICDRSLLAGYSRRSYTITGKMVKNAARGLGGGFKPARRKLRIGRAVLAPVAGVLLLALLAAVLLWLFGGGILSSGAVSGGKADGIGVPPSMKAADRETKPPAPIAEAPAPAGASDSTELRPDAPAEGGTAAPHPDAAADGGSGAGTPAARPVAAPAPGGTFFLLQVHSMATQEQADAAAADLKAKGYPVFVNTQESSGGVTWYVVWAGPYDSRGEAQQTAASLKKFRMAPIVRSRSRE